MLKKMCNVVIVRRKHTS